MKNMEGTRHEEVLKKSKVDKH